ncbi:MAG: hypothetical protein DCC49_08575 [Acidobacteria bacterium]|nr:MAG: hypothetical protein DCC49_08575 [Acidobacteriota bacterium]
MIPGYYDSPWPCEDGGPKRQATVRGLPSLDVSKQTVVEVNSREAVAATMVLLRDEGEVFLHGQTLGSSVTSWVEKIDPQTLSPTHRSPDLEAGPFWPGGVLIHQNGDIYVTCGRWCHRLDPECHVVTSVELPRERPYNSLLALPDGSLIMKDQVRDGSGPSRLVVLDPDGLEMTCGEVDCPEGVVARLSADGETVYVVGTNSVFRYRWNRHALSLELDDLWRVEYLTRPDQSYGWDPVIAGGCLWFMDNGDHRFSGTMRGAGVAQGAVHLYRAPIEGGHEGAFEQVAVSGLPAGSITNPPLYDEDRGIAIGFDSANGTLAAWRLVEGESAARDGKKLESSWEMSLATASHMLLFPGSGELVVNDHSDSGDSAVVVDIESGSELMRAETTSPIQSVVFPAPGWDRDFYYCSFARLARVVVGEVN